MPVSKRKFKEPPHPAISDYTFPNGGLIGEGTFGEVWYGLYKDDQPRAVKVFKPNMIRDDLWKEEYEKLKALDEPPGIVTLYDRGETEDGRPYVAMRLMAEETEGGGWKGRTLGDRIAADDLSSEVRWRLANEMADVLAYLHRQGVYHCDVKPENVLLSAGDETRPVLCDFGQSVGKGYSPERATGTFLYASPEQLRRDDSAIAGWDVYSFGVTAWQLLTGKLPRLSNIAQRLRIEDAATVMQRTMDSMSIASSSLGESLDRELIPKVMIEAIKTEREIEIPSEFKDSPDREEMEIIRRCLALDRDQPGRFRSMVEVVEAFQELNHRRAIATERRKKLLFVSLSILGVITTMVAAWQWSQAEGSRREAEALGNLAEDSAKEQTRLADVANQQREIADEQRATAEEQRGIAEREKEKALKSEATANLARSTAESLINSMLYDLKDRLEPLGRTDLLDDVSLEASNYFENLPDGQRNTASERERSTMLNNRGEVFLAKREFGNALETFRRAFVIRETLLAADPSSEQARRDLSVSHERIADTLATRGDLAEAEAHLRASLELRRKLMRDRANAETAWDAGLATSKLSGLLAQLRKPEPELALEGLDLLIPLGTSDEATPAIQRDFASALIRVGDLYQRVAQPDTALSYYERAEKILGGLFDASQPDDLAIRMDYGAILFRIGDWYAQTGHLEKAEDYLSGAVPLIREFAEMYPTNANENRHLAHLLSQKGQLHMETGEPDVGLSLLQESVEIFEGFPGESAWDLEQHQLALIALGETLETMGENDLASQRFQQSLEVARKHLAAGGETGQNFIVSLFKSAKMLLPSQPDQAERLLKEALTILNDATWKKSEQWADIVRHQLFNLNNVVPVPNP